MTCELHGEQDALLKAAARHHVVYWSFLDLIHLEDAPSELLGASIDVISAAALLERDADIRRDAVAL